MMLLLDLQYFHFIKKQIVESQPSEHKPIQISFKLTINPPLISNLENNNLPEAFTPPRSDIQNNSTNNSKLSNKTNTTPTQSHWLLLTLINIAHSPYRIHDQ